MKRIKIGTLELNNNCILAPMAGVTDLPFRLLCSRMGAGMVCMEMVSAKAILYNNKNTEEMLSVDEGERPASLQLFGSDPDIISEIAKRIEDRNFDILDINMGCPVPKIVNNGEGSALMKDPELVRKIVTKTAKAIKKPVTVKIRKGFDDEHVNAVEIAKIAEDSGVAAITVHGRTRQQYYEGKADWEIIAKVKEAVSIPVIGNGDITDGPSAERMLKETGVDGFMIGRAARGNPWIFKEIPYYLENGKTMERPSLDEIIDTIIEHASKLTEVKGEYIAVREMRRHIGYYTAGLKNSAAMRRDVNLIEDYDSLLKFLDNIRSNRYTSSGR
ncbi:MAG: tRNA dihydrouridine synthase DusB [Lachnospiraceae bacterium]|nr:tRNA dihydrouridine synthase DusB [Lachnospiraceae bacterium]